jgi:Asp-tRNA(Asn)/Glu-tRNA(Gln) amidotransferase A subunit family amidase
LAGDSVRGPASDCACAGIRPTIGLASRYGIIPARLNRDEPGVLGRTVEDMVRRLRQAVLAHAEYHAVQSAPNIPKTTHALSQTPSELFAPMQMQTGTPSETPQPPCQRPWSDVGCAALSSENAPSSAR